MKNKGVLVLVLVLMATGGVFAQEWYDSYAPGIADNNIFINAGIGLGPTGNYNSGIPPISASVDIKLPIDQPITVGAIVTFSTWKYISPYPGSRYEVTYTNIGFGGRGMWHFNFAENLDTYVGLTLGYVIQDSSVTQGVGIDYSTASSFFLWGFNLGARYFFNDSIGVFAELGYSGLQYGCIGVTFKF